MVQLLLLLLGSELVRRRWRTLAVLGAFWALIGAATLIDAVNGDTVLQPHYFGYFLLLEGVVVLLSVSVTVAGRAYRFIKAAVLIVPAVVIVLQPPNGNLVIAMLLGTVLLLDGAWRVASAAVVRFRGWKAALAAGIVEILFALATLQPWPTNYEGTIGFNVGALLLVSGLAMMQLANRLRRQPHDAPIARLLDAAFPIAAWDHQRRHPGEHAPAAVPGTRRNSKDELIVHVWTPAESARVGRRRPLIDRYVAAVDRNGVVSTGHAALELPPDLYISHYPAVEIERSPDAFGRILRAGNENDLPGRFLTDHPEEIAGWCPPTRRVRFINIDRERVRAFWQEYRKDTTYNLTSRNCSSAVARALDAGLEGMIGRSARPLRVALRAMRSSDLWAAGVLRNHAERMAWTPGLVLDYARLLRIVVESIQRRDGREP